MDQTGRHMMPAEFKGCGDGDAGAPRFACFKEEGAQP